MSAAVAHLIDLKLSFLIDAVGWLGLLAALRQFALVAVVDVETIVYIAAESLRAMEPRTRANKHAALDAGYGDQIFVDGAQIVVREVLENGPGHDLQQIAVNRGGDAAGIDELRRTGRVAMIRIDTSAHAPEDAKIFGDALREMTIENARRLLDGADTPITDYFKSKTCSQFIALRIVQISTDNDMSAGVMYRNPSREHPTGEQLLSGPGFGSKPHTRPVEVSHV